MKQPNLLCGLKPRPTLPRRAGYFVLLAFTDCVQDIEQLGLGLLQHIGRNFPAHLDGRNEIADRVSMCRGVLVGVSDVPVDWEELCAPFARWSQLTKIVETLLVVITAQRALQRLHYAIEQVEANKIG
jgi:hypothetical protein